MFKHGYVYAKKGLGSQITGLNMVIYMSREDCFPINQFILTDVVSSNPAHGEVYNIM